MKRYKPDPIKLMEDVRYRRAGLIDDTYTRVFYQHSSRLPSSPVGEIEDVVRPATQVASLFLRRGEPKKKTEKLTTKKNLSIEEKRHTKKGLQVNNNGRTK